MLSITASPPTGPVTGFNLGLNAFWRLSLGVTSDTDNNVYMAIMFYYPGMPGHPVPQIALAKVNIPPAAQPGGMESLTKVAAVSLEGGTVEADIARMTEAFNLFGNMPRVKREAIDSSVRDVTELLRGYWQLREWLTGDLVASTTIDACGTTLICRV